jgi:hypothetical protein
MSDKPVPPKGVSVGTPVSKHSSLPESIPAVYYLPLSFDDRQAAWMEVQRGLSAFFAPKELEWRIQSSGFRGDYPWAMALAYINNRAIEGRLDKVCGIGGWKNDFRELRSGYQCGLGLTIDGKEWVWKWDASDMTQVEAVKGGHSAAMKRAAQQWGIGRYLYYFPTCFAEIHVAAQGEKCPDGWNVAYVKVRKNDKDGVRCYWGTPAVPKWALPTVESVENEIKEW